MRKKSSRFGALLLTLCMVFFGLPASAMAETAVQVRTWEELKNAVESAAVGETTVIRMTEDIVVEESMTVDEGQEIVLDMQGHAITVTQNFSTRVFTNNGTLTIKGGGSIDVTAAGVNGYGTVNNFGVLTVVDGTFTSLKESRANNIYVREGGSAVFVEPTMYGGSGCIATEVNTTVEIQGGSYTNEWYPCIENRGYMTITGGTFVNTSCSSCTTNWGYTVRSGNGAPNAYLKIQGETNDSVKVTGVQGGLAIIESFADIYNGTYETVSCEKHTGGGTAFYALYVSGESGKVECNVYGGTFTAVTKQAAFVGNNNPGGDGGKRMPSAANFYGGTFKTNGTGDAVYVNEKIGGLSVTGGTYLKQDNTAENISQWIPKDDDGKPKYEQNPDGSVSGTVKGTQAQPFTSAAEYNAAVQDGSWDGQDVYLVIENGTFDESDPFKLVNVQKKQNPPKLHLTVTGSTFTGNTAKDSTNPSFMYLPNCQELVLDDCTFDARTDPGLKYGINWNLCGITGAQVSITNCTFKGTYEKNALKLNQRNGADDDADDVKPDQGNPKAASITSALIENCSFSGTKAVISLGSQGKGADGAASPSTGNFPITLRNNKTDISVELAYVAADGSEIPALAVNHGGSLDKVSQNDAMHAVIAVGRVEATSSRDGNIAYWVKTNADGTLAYFTDEACTQVVSAENVVIPAKKSSTPSDDTPSPGYRLPYISETTGGKNFVSDTTSNLTVNGKYQFRITSTDGHKPVMTVSNANFTVELASQSGNDYFYVIRCAGAAGSTANVLVDGIHVVVATVGTAGVVSDTTHPFTVAQGATYQFKLTSASRPTFTGNNANFTIAYVSNSGNDWFFKVTAVGAAGASTTFSANGVVVTTATIA